MKARIILFSCTLFFIFPNSQGQVIEERILDTFTKISITSEIEAELILAEKEKIELILENVEPDKIITEVVKNTLKVRAKTGSYDDAVMKVKIYFKDLEEIATTARASVWSYEDLYLDKIRFELSNGGATRLKIYTDTLEANISQGSIIVLKGKTNVQHVKVSSVGTFSAYEFEAKETYVSANTGGKAKINVSRYLNADATSAGWIGYVGEPEKVDQKTSLKGEVVKAVLDE